MKTVNVKNAFFGEKGTYRAFATSDGTVRVYDNVAGHFTTCHRLTTNQKKRVRALATN